MSTPQAQRSVLTARQEQVLGLVAQGRSAHEIAAALDLSPRTVRAHTDAIRVKLGAANVRQLPYLYRITTGRDPLQLDTPATAPELEHARPSAGAPSLSH
jgi:DNA-binding CsgD family transcriptional regulator